MNSTEDIYKGNNASDYQPPTRNPQSTTTNLQPNVLGVQSSDEQNDYAQQRLPTVNNLKVIVIQDSRSTTRAEITDKNTGNQSWVGPLWGCVVLALLIVIIWAVKILAKEQTPKLGNILEQAVNEPLIDNNIEKASKKIKPKKNRHKKNSKKKK